MQTYSVVGVGLGTPEPEIHNISFGYHSNDLCGGECDHFLSFGGLGVSEHCASPLLPERSIPEWDVIVRPYLVVNQSS